MTSTVNERLIAFKNSSAFTSGDPQSFQVVLSEAARLPGRYDPADYVNRLGIDVSGKHVLVVCPGNGGLCIAALKAGAASVVALEPRDIYRRSLNTVSELATEVVGRTFSHSIGRKLFDKSELAFWEFDLIFWTEGVDEITHPKALLEFVFKALAPQGSLYIELSHGQHGVLPDSINSWRPTKKAFKDTVAGFSNLRIVSELEGRNQVRSIYAVENTDARAPVDPQDGAGSNSEIAEPQSIVTSVQSVPETAVERLAARIKEIIPTESPVELDVPNDLDSLYEGRSSTPKAKKRQPKRQN